MHPGAQEHDGYGPSISPTITVSLTIRPCNATEKTRRAAPTQSAQGTMHHSLFSSLTHPGLLRTFYWYGNSIISLPPASTLLLQALPSQTTVARPRKHVYPELKRTPAADAFLSVRGPLAQCLGVDCSVQGLTPGWEDVAPRLKKNPSSFGSVTSQLRASKGTQPGPSSQNHLLPLPP